MTDERPPLGHAEMEWSPEHRAWVVQTDGVRFMGREYLPTPGGLWVPEEDVEIPEAPEVTAVDLFAGAGGFSLGLHQAGIDVVAAVENEPIAAQTYLLNLGRPDCRIDFVAEEDREAWEASRAREARRREKAGLEPEPEDWIGSAWRAATGCETGCRAMVLGDVRAVTGDRILDAAGVDHADIVVGGPPCQGLSRANANAALGDPRNAMLWEFMRLVRELRPGYWIMENVPPLFTCAGGALFEALAHMATEVGYTVTAGLLDAVHYGVPQYRRRAIVAGTLRDGSRPVYRFPMPTHFATVRTPEGDNTTMRFYGEEREAYERRARGAVPPVAFDYETRTWHQAEEPDDGPPAQAELDL